MWQPSPTSNYTRQPCRTLIVCVSPPGATSSRLDGPSEKVQVRKPKLMFPNGTREAIVPWMKGRTAGITASRAPEFKNLRAIQALGGFQPLIRPSVTPDFMSGRYSVDLQSSRVCVENHCFSFLLFFLQSWLTFQLLRSFTWDSPLVFLLFCSTSDLDVVSAGSLYTCVDISEHLQITLLFLIAWHDT